MQTENQNPTIAMTPRYRQSRTIDLLDMLSDMETFANLVRMAACSLEGYEREAIASGAVEVVMRIEDVREIVKDLQRAA